MSKKTSNSYLNSKEFDGFDLCLWDADHNYFNLLRDLKDLHMKSKIGDQILIQGIEKWNRKDQYANPKNIPLEFYFGKKQFFKFPSGILLKWPLLEMVKILNMQVGCYISQKTKS